MDSRRASRFPAKSRAKFIEWETYSDRDSLIHAEFTLPAEGKGKPQKVHLSMEPDDFYEFTEHIRCRYDEVCGI